MKYKNYQEVLKAPDYIGAMKQYLKDIGMTHDEWSVSEEARKASAEAARWRFTSPDPFLPLKKKDSTKN